MSEQTPVEHFADLTNDDKIAWMARDPDGYWAAARTVRREELSRQEQPEET